MSFIFKIVLLSGLLFSALLSNIDECKSDLYYANGIMIDVKADVAEAKWQKEVKKLFIDNKEEYKKLSNINVSYNASQGFFDDIFESFEQVMSNEWGWSGFSNYFRTYLELKGYQEFLDLHRPDLTAQVNAYKQSIKDGHGVIVIAHSQGNYYTNEAYEELDEWMKDYFHMFGVATPANHVAGYAVGDTTAPYVKFHNDMINVVVTGLPSNRDDSHHQGFPSYDAHDFYDSYLTNTETRNDIFNFIIEKIQAHGNAPSQWETAQEFDKGTIDYKITVKHRFDPSIVMSEQVYPFAPSKKLYYVSIGTIPGYVKASCGGTEISASWTGQQDNEFYMINNPEKEKISGGYICTVKEYDGPINGPYSHAIVNATTGSVFFGQPFKVYLTLYNGAGGGGGNVYIYNHPWEDYAIIESILLAYTNQYLAEQTEMWRLSHPEWEYGYINKTQYCQYYSYKHRVDTGVYRSPSTFGVYYYIDFTLQEGLIVESR